VKKRVTIVDLAREVGVTPGTISRALSNDPRVKEETRNLVLSAAKKHHYQPNLSARLFKKGRTKNVGFFSELPSWVFYNNYFGRLISGVAQAAHEDGVKLVFYFSNTGDAAKSKNHLTEMDELMDGRVDGAIVLKDEDITEEQAEFFRTKSPVPLVLINNTKPTSGFFQLTAGTYERNRVALKYLFSKGHRKIGVIGLSPGGEYNRVCLNAFQDFYSDEGLVFKTEFMEVPPAGRDIADVKDLTKSLSSLKGKGVTAVVCSDDLQGFLSLEILKRMGVRVPQEMSVLSFGQVAREASLQDPLLSMVETDLEAGGRRAYEFFKEALDGKSPRAESLIWRAPAVDSSAGPAPR
jgi:LacI family transcriptional regulator